MTRAWLIGVACGLLCAGVMAAEPKGSFTPDERGRIDANALWGPREKTNLTKVEAYGSLLQWLVARTPLEMKEEVARAKLRDEALRKEHKASEPGAETQQVFDTLIAALPRKQRKDYEFTLTVLEGAKVEALTLGAGRMFVNADVVESASRDELAFLLAHELGHHALGHPRRIYQRLWLDEMLKKDLEDEVEDKRMLDVLPAVGTILEYVYSREEKFQADLFATQLCRNAGYDVEQGLDYLRRAAVKEDASLLKEPTPRADKDVPPIDPEITSQRSGEQLTLASGPTAAQRLRRLRLELDGLIYGESFGLFEYDAKTKTLQRAADKAIGKEERVVVCVHGMESSLEVYRGLMERLGKGKDPHPGPLPRGEGVRILGFQYPADESLYRSSRFLRREMQRVAPGVKHVDFVCHSAGGLVCRHYIEVEQGAFHRVYFQGTPHGGSDLARLRSLLEVVQFAGDIKLGYDAALQKAIMDGHGQISYDLQPGSLFLTHLNAPRENLRRERYTIYRGEAYSKSRVFLLKAAVEAARIGLDRGLRESRGESATLTAFGRAALEKLVLPAEIANGDLCVTLESATLQGVTVVFTHPLKHTELPRDKQVIEHVAELLEAEE